MPCNILVTEPKIFKSDNKQKERKRQADKLAVDPPGWMGCKNAILKSKETIPVIITQFEKVFRSLKVHNSRKGVLFVIFRKAMFSYDL